MNKFKTSIYSDSYLNLHENLLSNQNLHIFHGHVIDQRGQALFDNFPSASFHLVSYNPETMEFSINNNIINYNDTNFITSTISNYHSQFFIDSTTLGLTEIYYLIKQFLKLQINKFKVLYIEPQKYNKDENNEFYLLSNYPIGFRPIPGAVTDLHHGDVETGIFFLGFDSTRMQIALEEFQMIQDKNVKAIFGTPAFHAGLEMESIIPHLEILLENRSFEINYCSANDPSSAYELLLFHKRSLDEGNKMFIAPLGPKPTTIASALFANLHEEEVSLLYDHPSHLPNRTSGVKSWHMYSFYLTSVS
ncbi:hypothetical protein A1Z85_RS10905 [Acinetobacter baumannii]|uniref:hypothetical protein n=1 Tax=Acinetobacter baumannii TaxID=470 RepID=UPI00028EB001|nr:hypothetical protein [Acinetobacter baumannii]EHU1441305.1 hypothetical protein [Acinetobacter baumannii]EHU1809125.1 hypothetical protein [Acinetobacter baumannii]EHU2698513.1 hypothetical protein [Acinetobacter baumannii]EKL59589.1 hypothetical protein ACIN5110_2368 [Acinetobacter baumannii OIFC110]MDC5288113.1 hypothetical protein [Acinetobacter baumannii]